MLTTVTIFLPIAAALLLWVLPLRNGRVIGGLAFSVVVVELVLWAIQVGRFDFVAGGLQSDVTATWLADLGVSYKVGVFDFSLWLVGLMILVSAAAIGFAMRVGRERPRMYYGLILLLLGATIGVFTAQDLLLFYVFFEAMLIPLYVLIGVWGGRNRSRATITMLVYTMFGSLLMLVAIVAYGLTAGTFDLTQMGASSSVWIFLGFMIAFLIKAPVFPFHGWLPGAYREAPPEVSALLSGVISKTAAYAVLRIVIPHFPEPVEDFQEVVLALAAIGLIYSALLAFRQPDFRGIVAYSSLGQMCLIFIGLFALNDSGLSGANLQMINHGLVSAGLFLLAGVIENRTGTGELRELGGLARGRPLMATTVIMLGVIALAVPGSGVFAAEFLVLNGVFAVGWGWAVVGAVSVVFAAAYMLRAISATLHTEPGPAVRKEMRDLGLREVAFLAPILAALLVLSFYPAAVTDRSFDGKPAQAVDTRFEP